MKIILFALPGNEDLTNKLTNHLAAEKGEAIIRHFPDGETFVQLLSEVKEKCVIMVCTLHEPDEKILPLFFLCQTAKSLGAKYTCLVAPYLSYMRQDRQFHAGEGVTSDYFGRLLSGFADSLVTIDPHLHRRKNLSEIYSIPNIIVQAAGPISSWIKANVREPLLIGPDSESEQWVSSIAQSAGAPFIILQKIRMGDRKVEVSFPNVEKYKDHTPVLIDDIISTAHTMIETVIKIKNESMKPPVCIGTHAVFAGTAYEDLLNAGAGKIVTCNTIPHPSNQIDLSPILAENIKQLMNQMKF